MSADGEHLSPLAAIAYAVALLLIIAATIVGGGVFYALRALGLIRE